VNDFSQLLQQGASHAWLFFPTAVVLGALHGLEPGHSKTMMAAFIVAIRGTIAQAVLLGFSAAVSHSLVIWALAAFALSFGSHWSAETAEPYFQLVSAVIVGSLAVWMFWRTRRDVLNANAHSHDHTHAVDGDQQKSVRTERGEIKISMYEDGVPPVFRLEFRQSGKLTPPADPGSISAETLRPNGTRQVFAFRQKGDLLESTTSIPEPHEFELTLRVALGDHQHEYRIAFDEHDHDHHGETFGNDYEDAHERAHALDIEKRFANQNVGTAQIVLFGLTGGLMPCPAAFSILIICLQLKHFTLGFALVLAFSIGLALTLVATGSIAAWSVRHAERRFREFGSFARRLPYLSSAFLFAVALYIGITGWRGVALHQ
jgi:nickel/cobalt exporter